jgi:LuxR family maltose regulon positive regulatory protein
MKLSALLHTKFLVPQPAADHVLRPHLISWLENQLDKRLILLSAPPGYGKTTLLVDFLTSSSMPIAWVQLDETDSDPNVFLACILEAISRLCNTENNNIGHTTRTLLENVNASISPQQILTVLINELSEIPLNNILLVLEDFHFISSPVIYQLVDFLLENGPASIHIIISTRLDPPIALARLRAHGMLAELRTQEFSFTEEETLLFVNQSIPNLSDESLGLLVEKTEGWPAALQIVKTSLQCQDSESADRFIAGLSGSHRYIFEYLADEVFRRQNRKRQNFLLNTSIISQMDAETCNALPGISNAHKTLDQLEKENLFLTSLDVNRHWYRYHHLFREFLLSKLQLERPDETLKLHRIAGSYYEQNGEMETAFSHYVDAKEWEAASEVIQAFAPVYLESGRVEVLNHYLSRLPDDVLRAHPELCLQRGNARLRLGEVGLAINDFEDARTVFKAAANLGGVSKSLIRLAEIYRAQGNYRHAETTASEALSNASNDDHSTRAEALMALAKSVGFLTSMDQGRSLAEKAIEEAHLAENRISPISHANFLQSIGQICWWHGDPKATIRYCKEALQLTSDNLSPIAAQANISLVSPYLYRHELDTAFHHATRGLEIAQTLHIRELLPSAYSAMGNVLTRRGELAHAEECMLKAMEIAQTLGLASYERLMTAGYLAYNLYCQGRLEEAEKMAESALWSYTGNQDTYEAYVCFSVLADIAIEQGHLFKAETLYQQRVEVGERRQFRIPLAMVYFGLAYIHLETNRHETGIEFAQKALQLIEPTQAFQLFLDQGERCRIVCKSLQENGVNCHFIQHVMDNLPETPTVKSGERTKIYVQTLGTFRVFIDDKEIFQDRWISAKARDLLAYFITTRGNRIPSEQIFNAIWVDKPGRGMTAFHTALSRLRNALRQGNESSRIIFVESGEYWLDLSDFSIDLFEYENRLSNAQAAASEDLKAQFYEQAIQLYHGDYLNNLYYDWLFTERQRLTQAHISALFSLANYHFAHNRYTISLELLNRILRMDNLNEEVYCQAMRNYAALGNQAGLLNQYQEMVKTLSEELGLEPLGSTIKLFQKLTNDLKSS